MPKKGCKNKTTVAAAQRLTNCGHFSAGHRMLEADRRRQSTEANNKTVAAAQRLTNCGHFSAGHRILEADRRRQQAEVNNKTAAAAQRSTNCGSAASARPLDVAAGPAKKGCKPK